MIDRLRGALRQWSRDRQLQACAGAIREDRDRIAGVIKMRPSLVAAPIMFRAALDQIRLLSLLIDDGWQPIRLAAAGRLRRCLRRLLRMIEQLSSLIDLIERMPEESILPIRERWDAAAKDLRGALRANGIAVPVAPGELLLTLLTPQEQAGSSRESTIQPPLMAAIEDVRSKIEDLAVRTATPGLLAELQGLAATLDEARRLTIQPQGSIGDRRDSLRLVLRLNQLHDLLATVEPVLASGPPDPGFHDEVAACLAESRAGIRRLLESELGAMKLEAQVKLRVLSLQWKEG